jgi:outer membrane protein OmpU
MTNIKKIGLSALAGSLVAFSANAAEMSVSGGSEITYTSGKPAAAAGDEATTTLGFDTDLTFSASGDVNGMDVSTFVAYTDAAALESAAITIDMGSLGTVGLGKGGGTNINGAYDETYPRAYEETSDAGGNSASNAVGSYADGNALIYNFPALNVGGVDLSVGAEYSLQHDSDTSANGAALARSTAVGNAYGVGVTASASGFTVGAYASEGERRETATTTGSEDIFSGSAFINYTAGPVSVGYQKTHFNSGLDGTTSATTAAKTVGTSGGVFEEESMSIAFNVNDNLSISYAETDSDYSENAIETGDTAATSYNVTQKSDSIQIAYSMGAMSIKAYRTEIKNPYHDEDAADIEANEIAIGLAF